MGTNNGAVGELQEIYITIGLIGNDRKDIDIGNLGVNNGRFGLIILQDVELLFYFLRFFKGHVFGMLLHLKFKLLQRVFKISFDDGANGFDVLVVVFGTNFIYTRCKAVSQVVF